MPRTKGKASFAGWEKLRYKTLSSGLEQESKSNSRGKKEARKWPNPMK